MIRSSICYCVHNCLKSLASFQPTQLIRLQLGWGQIQLIKYMNIPRLISSRITIQAYLCTSSIGASNTSTGSELTTSWSNVVSPLSVHVIIRYLTVIFASLEICITSNMQDRSHSLALGVSAGYWNTSAVTDAGWTAAAGLAQNWTACPVRWLQDFKYNHDKVTVTRRMLQFDPA